MRFNDIRVAGELLKFFPAFLLMLSFYQASKVSASNAIPDFAFPQEVKESTDSLLEVSLKEGNQLMTLRSALNLCIADNILKDSETARGDIVLFDSIAKSLSGAYRSLGFLIEAEILKEEYASNSGVYDQRNLPLDSPYPDDPQEWSGDMFKTRILELVKEATTGMESLPDLSISEISPLIEDTNSALKIGLNVPQFIAFEGIRLLKSFISENNSTIIPFYPEEEKSSIEGQCETAVKAILASLIDNLSKNNSYIEALAYIEYSKLMPMYDREQFLNQAIVYLKDTEGEGLILYELWNDFGNDNTRYYNLIKSYLTSFPKSYNNERLRYALSLMTQERIEVEFPRTALPAVPIKGSASLSNLNKGYLLVYHLEKNQVDAYDGLILKKFTGRAVPIHSIELKCSDTVPFQTGKDVELPGLSAGLYVVIPSKTRTLSKGWNKATSNANYSTIRVSDISILSQNSSNEKDSGKVYVVKGKNQQPVGGAIVTYYSGSSKRPKGRLITNKDGWVNIPEGYYRLEATWGRSVAKSEAGFNYYPSYNNIRRNATILTDLSIYRPGDTVRYVVVGWTQDNVSNSILTNTKIEITLRDANYQESGKQTLILNKEGRAVGEFVIPQGKLLGTYTLIANYPDYPGYGGGSANIEIEDYRLPAFLVTLEQKQNKKPGMLSFSGCANTYAGMPVTDAKVSIKIEYVPWRWAGINFRGNSSYFETTFTNSNGDFEINLPLNNLEESVFSHGRYTIKATVTSQSGETCESTALTFYLGKEDDIRPFIKDKTKLCGDSVLFHVPVYDMAGMPQKVVTDYKIINLNDTAIRLSGKFVSPTLTLPCELLKSGKYSFEFKTENSAKSVSTESVLWRETDSVIPFPTPLWIPENLYTYKENDEYVEVKFGAMPNEWILYVLSEGEKILSSEWISPQDSLIVKAIPVRNVYNSTLFINLCGMYDLHSETARIRIEPSSRLDKMSVKAQSFRDKISSGDKEEWTFDFSIDDKNAENVNVFAVMTDKALNAIHDFRWVFDITLPDVYSKVNIRAPFYGSGITYKNFSSIAKYPRYIYPVPGWQTYGYPIISSGWLSRGGIIEYKSMAVMNAKSESAAGKITADASDEVAMESLQEDSGVEEEGEAIELRPIEMPLAFFKPNLKTNEKGEVTVKFEVPNFNTTWQLQIAGYNEKLQCASLVLDATASKPVMVKSNLPQFLRTGDKASISATLYNNSEELLPVNGKIEIIDAISGNVLATYNFDEEELAPSSNRVVNLRYDVPDDLSSIAVRAYALSGNYSDGEQGIIPILPSSMPVTDAVTFYLDLNEDKFELKLPKVNKNANVTLRYCDNPLWEVLLALPGLTYEGNGSSLSIAGWLYGTLTASDIIGSNPDIAQGLSDIINSADTTMAKGNLDKNQSLKIVPLQETPWVNEASAETARIKSLSKYLDKESTDAQLAMKWNELKRLQQSDGGWSWFEGFKSSPYITSEIIRLMAYLNKYRLLGVDDLKMVHKAVKYYDGYLKAKIKKDKNLDVISTMNYLYSRDMLNETSDNAMMALAAECRDSIVNQWKHWNIGEKAMGALVLIGNDNYKEDVFTICKSLKEFIGKRTPITQEALLLELFEKMEPSGEAVAKIREILFLKKETQDWGVNPSNAGIIHALVETSPKEVYIGTNPIITIDGESVSLPNNMSLTGNFTININAKKVSGKKLLIERTPGLPAWGGIVSQYIAPIKEIKKTKVDYLSIEKQIFKEGDDGTTRKVDTFEKGDKITVVLNIDCRKDMDYVVITDSRAACLQPDIQESGLTWIDGLLAYREVRSDKTSFFIENLPAGKYVISYDCHADREGEYSLGIAETQSLYSPTQVSHTSGNVLKVRGM